MSLHQFNKILKSPKFQLFLVSSTLRSFCSARLNFSYSFCCSSSVSGVPLVMEPGIRFLILFLNNPNYFQDEDSSTAVEF